MKRKRSVSSATCRYAPRAVLAICSLAHFGMRCSGEQIDIEPDGSFEHGIGSWYGSYGVFGYPDAADGTHVAAIMPLTFSSVDQPLFQLLPTIPGQTYTISFALRSGAGFVGDQGVPTPVKVGWSEPSTSWFDTTVMQAQNTSRTTWEHFQFEAVATSKTSQLTFLNPQSLNIELLDDVHVWYSSVPDSGSTIMLLGSFAACLSAAGRRKFVHSTRSKHQ